ncbi:MAG: GPW/gp25 family protein [Lachnospiraceae bacterium]
MAEDRFLGTGMKFPPQINPTTGRFTCVSGAESIRESVYLILMTQRSERLMRPDFGSNIMGYVFAQADATMMHLMADEIASDIMRGEPRIEDVNVIMDDHSKPGCLFVHIDYTVRDTNVRENMVFPFYLGEEPEEESEAYETMEE